MIDTHAHLTSNEYKDDLNEVLERAFGSGIKAIICVGFDLESSRQCVALAEKHQMVFAAVGIHPHDAIMLDQDAIREIELLCGSKKVVAIGEIGLDFYRNLSPKDCQERAFLEQIAIARKTNLPIIVHSREAHKRVIDILRSERVKEGVMHCFSGGPEIARTAVDLGLYISLAGPVTYGGSKFGEILKIVPKDRLLIETDCPYLSPVPHRGKRNEPAYLRFVAERLAAMLGLSFEDFSSITDENASRLFGIGKTA